MTRRPWTCGFALHPGVRDEVIRSSCEEPLPSPSASPRPPSRSPRSPRVASIHEGCAVESRGGSLRGDGFTPESPAGCGQEPLAKTPSSELMSIYWFWWFQYSARNPPAPAPVIHRQLASRDDPRPRIAVVLDAGDVLVSDQLRRHERCRIGKRLAVCPSDRSSAAC